MTPAMEQLCADATAKGFTIIRNGNALKIFKARGRTITSGVVVYLSPGDGFFQSIRADTGDLTACTAIRTIRATRKVLGL